MTTRRHKTQAPTQWHRSGAPYVWLTAGAVSMCLLMVFGLLGLIASRGLVHFWPKPIVEYRVTIEGQPSVLLGEIADQEEVAAQTLRDLGVALDSKAALVTRYLVKVGNRDQGGADFRWIPEPLVTAAREPADAVVLERTEWGNFYGFVRAVERADGTRVEGAEAFAELQRALAVKRDIESEIEHIEKGEIGRINYAMERVRLDIRRLELKDRKTDVNLAPLTARQAELEAEYEQISNELGSLYTRINQDRVVMQMADGREVALPVARIVRATQPNALGFAGKIGFYFSKLGEFVFDDPREANTEGGVFPAIFGTVLMVMLMSVFVTPFGVIAAVYLREYAKQGPVTRAIRIAVNNLAGVPSVVYGVFGLGFFVYFLGGNLDRLFFPAALPAPTFGTPGLLWSSLTLAILTVPVVIVATEEGLSRIPRAIREGSLALGATKAETLWRTVLPMATPAMMTGLILAVARAAGEVAPLMMVGVVKLAPSLAVDANLPFLHLDRKFMHLGFHIYDVGFQSPNVEAARPLVYATALLLVVIIVSLNLAAIGIRNRLREKYGAAES